MGLYREIRRAVRLTIRHLPLIGHRSTSSHQPPKSKRPRIYEWMLFYPVKYPVGRWNPQGLVKQDVWIESKDGTKLHAWYCPCENPRAVILITHGNAGNVAYRTEWLTILQQQFRVTTLIIDYRGYGRSEGVPTIEGVIEDSQAARRRVAELAGVNEADVVLMGESLGGAIAIQLARMMTPRALIVQSSFRSLQNVAWQNYGPLAWVIPASKLNSWRAIGEIHCPILISHGAQDRLIRWKSIRKLVARAHAQARFILLDEVGHNDWITARYLATLEEFFSALERTGAKPAPSSYADAL
ncbi:2-succinyl-6-hydroxy-2,4-cyclohexadiene-1-carboxylate synthase [Planctopirus ephydatiae]|uniref:2-succinyl-6-hydroxy-2, 4-cyclohexadiene-1-carboxylate synthase n=1 Tax=Planctopirus ephydatiae TaxID=2528019 RepID=A0A518GRQ8_9PLAN|nr:alpha/beta hydrolase [Planctopirus ephydatiae]QDV31221.1 2-succinyl-6-hydroxy-2,4-cyclohexadiene-1-carboxylate synthase [Planctopirus ephydatiae]